MSGVEVMPIIYCIYLKFFRVHPKPLKWKFEDTIEVYACLSQPGVLKMTNYLSFLTLLPRLLGLVYIKLSDFTFYRTFRLAKNKV